MTGRRAIIALCALCALLVSAVAAQAANAETNGTTAVTCGKVSLPDGPDGTSGFKDAGCTEQVANSNGEKKVQYEHLAFAGGTEITGKGGETLLHSVISGVEVELKSTELTGSGSMENMLAESGEHTANGTGVIEYKGVTVVKPAGKGCAVEGGEVKTNTLKATTAGQGMGLKFEPNSGTIFASFKVTGCSISALNGTYEVTGSVVGEPVGTGTVFTRAGTTAQKTLKLRGQNAGIAGTLNLIGANGNPLAATTVSTP